MTCHADQISEAQVLWIIVMSPYSLHPPRSWSFLLNLREIWKNNSHKIHVWYTYLHLPYKSTKCGEIYYTWILWEFFSNKVYFSKCYGIACSKSVFKKYTKRTRFFFWTPRPAACIQWGPEGMVCVCQKRRDPFFRHGSRENLWPHGGRMVRNKNWCFERSYVEDTAAHIN